MGEIIPFNQYPELNNHQDPEFNFLVTQLFEPIDYISTSKHQKSDKNDTKTSKIFQRFNDFIKDYRIHVGPNLYPAARLILPYEGNGVMFIREEKMKAICKKLLNIPKKGTYAKKLDAWKARNRGNNDNNESLPQIIAQAVKDYRDVDFNLNEKQPVTINEICEFLDELGLKTKIDEQVELCRSIFDRLSISCIRWLVTIILKDSTIHGYKKIFFLCYHPQASSLYGSCKNLQTVIKFLHDPNKFFPQEQFNPQFGMPFTPMSSQRLKSYQQVVKSMPSGFFIEEKVDGDRMLLHYKDGEFVFWTRRIRNYTNIYGDSFKHGALTGHLKEIDSDYFFSESTDEKSKAFQGPFHPNTTSLILDGEMVAYDKERGVILPFGTLREASIQEGVKQFNTTDMYENMGAHPFFLVFDILEFNGKSFIYDYKNKPDTDKSQNVALKGHGQTLEWRKNFLKKVINPVPTRLEILPFIKGNTAIDIENAMRKIISQRCEGIMVKSVKGLYQIDTRSFASIKIKPEYLEEFGDNLDLPIIGIIRGKQKHSYMFGIWDLNLKTWRSFCTVSNGFRLQDYTNIENLLRPNFEDKCPNNVVFGTRKPDVYINPENSIIIEIKARSLQESVEGQHHTKTTLHNSWARMIRDDKSSKDSTTFQDFLQKRQDHSLQLSKNQQTNKKRRKMISSVQHNVNLKPVSKLFNNLNFLILSDYLTSERIEVEKLKNIVITYGGKILLDPKTSGNEQVIIISDLLTPIVKSYLNLGFDIIKPRWIFDCIKNMTLIQLNNEMLFKTINPKLKAEINCDEFGDSYFLMSDKNIVEYLKGLPIDTSKHLPSTGDISSDIDWESDSEERAFESNPILLKNLFRGITFKLIGVDVVKERLTLKINQFGGTINDENPSFIVVVPSSNMDDNNEINQEANSLSKSISDRYQEGDLIPRFVIESFIDSCINNGTLVDAQDHLYI